MDCSENMEGSQIFGFTMMILAVAPTMVLAVKAYKREMPAGLGKSILLCIGVGFLASVLYVIGWAFTHHFIVPEFMDQFMALYQKKYQAGKMSKEDFEMAQWMADHYHNPFWFFIFTMVEIFPLTIALAILIPVILKYIPQKKS